MSSLGKAFRSLQSLGSLFRHFPLGDEALFGFKKSSGRGKLQGTALIAARTVGAEEGQLRFVGDDVLGRTVGLEEGTHRPALGA